MEQKKQPCHCSRYIKTWASSHFALLSTSYCGEYLTGPVLAHCSCSVRLLIHCRSLPPVLPASTPWLSQPPRRSLSPPSLPVPSPLSLCLLRLSLCPSWPIANHFSLLFFSVTPHFGCYSHQSVFSLTWSSHLNVVDALLTKICMLMTFDLRSKLAMQTTVSLQLFCFFISIFLLVCSPFLGIIPLSAY